MRTEGLTARQERFALEYVIDLNGTQAAIRAGYGERAAASEASRLLRNAKIRGRVNALLDDQAKELNLSAAFVLRGLLRVAGFDMSSLYDATGKLLPANQMPEEARFVLQEVEETETPKGNMRRRYRTAGRIEAFTLLGKHLRMFATKTGGAGADGTPLKAYINVDIAAVTGLPPSDNRQGPQSFMLAQ
jgi:phage terminase small subunit